MSLRGEADCTQEQLKRKTPWQPQGARWSHIPRAKRATSGILCYAVRSRAVETRFRLILW